MRVRLRLEILGDYFAEIKNIFNIIYYIIMITIFRDAATEHVYARICQISYVYTTYISTVVLKTADFDRVVCYGKGVAF